MNQKIHYAKTLVPLCKCRGKNVCVSDVLFKVNCPKCLLKIFPYSFVYLIAKKAGTADFYHCYLPCYLVSDSFIIFDSDSNIA